jgi:asparagine synthase (glutamine-hydrolysing)
MCGIAGILSSHEGGGDQGEAAKAEAYEMIGAIAHRGPNGIRVEQVAGATLAHARLSIIDLEGGWQPLHAAGSTIIGNGEIYNYIELAEEFGLKGKLSTGSDFEPLLHLYALEGEAAFGRLRGMYAFCLIGCDGRTWLVRDPFGIKPLYVAEQHSIPLGETTAQVRFASEALSILRPDWGLKPDPEFRPSLHPYEQLLALGYSLAGYPIPAVLSAKPGEVLEVRSDGFRRHCTLSTAHPRGSGDLGLSGGAAAKTWVPASAGMSGEKEAIRELDRVLEDSVRVHQRSDVPYGLFLSGGIDSTAIATLMARLNEHPVTAFTCGFDIAEARDERGAAEKVARALNLDWRETTFTEEDFWRIAPEIAWHLDDPTTDYACLPTYKLAEAAKGTLTVVLSGEGGDELFAGYGRYRRALRPKWMGGRPAEPQIDAPFLKDKGAGALARWRAAAEIAAAPGMTPLQRAQAADIATWLPNDLLLKLDRMLMAHGLEGRTPFLDREVAAFAMDLPDRMKVRGRYGKWILRKWLERACPAAEPWAKKKGFTVPVAAWIAPRAADIGPRVAACEGLAAICDLDAVRTVFSDPAQAQSRWPLIFYALWWSIHVGGASKAEAAKAVFG